MAAGIEIIKEVSVVTKVIDCHDSRRNCCTNGNDFIGSYPVEVQNCKDGQLLVFDGSKFVNKYDVPENFVPGALIMVDESGNKVCTDITYEELLDKINSSSGGGNSGSLPTDLVPGSILIGSESGGIESSDIKISKLQNIFDSLGKKVEFVDEEILPGSLVLADKSGNLRSSGKTYNQLIEDIQKSSVQSDWDVTDPTDPAFIKNKPVIDSSANYDKLEELINSKPSILGQVIPGSLMMADDSGNLRSSYISYEDVVLRDSIITGSLSAYVEATEDKLYTIIVPYEIRPYPAINVYHNGKLLIENIHYTMDSAKEFITLTGFFAYKGEFFNFVGYGSTTMMMKNIGGGGCDHSHTNLELLESITQERIDKWDSNVGDHDHSEYLKKGDVFLPDSNIINPNILPVATESVLGMVKSSNETNEISVADDGIMSVNHLDVSKLVSTTSIGDNEYEDYSIILSSGSSLSYKE